MPLIRFVPGGAEKKEDVFRRLGYGQRSGRGKKDLVPTPFPTENEPEPPKAAKRLESFYLLARSLARPAGCHCLVPNSFLSQGREISGFSGLVLCLATLGSGIGEAVEDCFAEKDYSGGYLLDQIGNAMLFGLSEEMNRAVAAGMRTEGFRLSPPYFPGDGAFRLEDQAALFREMQRQGALPAEINGHGLLSPEKTMFCFFGADRTGTAGCDDDGRTGAAGCDSADKTGAGGCDAGAAVLFPRDGVGLAGKGHDCARCARKDCAYRKQGIRLSELRWKESNP